MNLQRITVSLPEHVYDNLMMLVDKGAVSRFIAEATEERILEEKTKKKDPVEEFIALRGKLPKLSDRKIFAAIRKGRM